jgi:bifunctional DNA-binding transcriptional regulator/antitoxin component of YhaV-PrlF toxin-antitoxin module
MEHVGYFGGDQENAVLLVDTIGRVRIPDHFRDALGITERVRARTEEDRLILERHDKAIRMERDHIE